MKYYVYTRINHFGREKSYWKEFDNLITAMLYKIMNNCKLIAKGK